MTRKPKEKLFIYCRVSGSSQRDGASLEVQEKIGRETAKRHNLKPELLFEGVASSHYESLEKRPKLRYLLLKIKDGEVKHLFSWDIDRLSRNKRVSSILLMDMEENGVTYYTNQGVVDTSVRDQMLMLEVKSLFASHDNALRTERMKQSKLYKIKKYGTWGGGQLPFGFTTIDKKLTPHPEESKWVKKIYRWFYDGKSIIWIKSALDKEGVLARRGGLFSTGSINRLLQNTHHIGYYQHTDKETGEVIDLTCSPIVDETIWNQVQEKRKRILERKKQNNRNTKYFYLLRDLMWCDHCGSKMSGRISPPKKEYLYYCPNKERNWKNGVLPKDIKWKRGKVGSHGCDNVRSVSIPLMDEFISNKVKETLTNSNILKEKFKEEVLKTKSSGGGYENERQVRLERTKKNRFEKDIQKIQSSLADVETGNLLDEFDDSAVYQRIRNNLSKKLKDLKEKLEQSRLRIKQLGQENLWVDWVSKYHDKLVEWDKFSDMEKKDSIGQFVDKILVRLDHKTNEHIITMKFKLPLVGDKLEYKDDTKKSKGYIIIDGETVDEVHIPVGKPRKDSRSHRKKSDGVTIESHPTTPLFHRY